MVTVSPRGDGIALLYTSIVFLALSWLTFTTRIVVRVWRKALGLDDYAMLIGLVRSTSVSFPQTNDQSTNAFVAALYGHSQSVYRVQLLRIRSTC